MTICPACGQHIIAYRVPVEALTSAPLSNVRRTIVRKLVERYPLDVTPDSLIAEIYRGSCEPEFARQALSVQVSKLRVLLKPYGWTIPASRPGRGNTSHYRLEQLP